MTDIAVTIRLPEKLVRQAREFGVLDDQVIVKLLEGEVARRAAGSPNADIDEERERDKAIQTTREILAGLDAIEPAMSAQEVDEAIKAVHYKR